MASRVMPTALFHASLPPKPKPFASARTGRVRSGSLTCKALSESSPDPTVYRGVYGPWTVDPADVREVLDPFSLFFIFNSYAGNHSVREISVGLSGHVLVLVVFLADGAGLGFGFD